MQSLGVPYDATLEAPTAFEKTVRIVATRGTETVEVSSASGSLTQDRRRSMRWNGQLTIPITPDLVPSRPSDILTPFGTRVDVFFGVRLTDGSVSETPYGTYLLDSAAASVSRDSAAVTLDLIDPARRISDYRFEQPYIPASYITKDLAAWINDIVFNRTGVDPDLDLTGEVPGRRRVFGLDPQLDPWREMQDMATDRGYVLYYGRFGDLHLEQVADPDPSDAQPLMGVVTVDAAFDRHPANVVSARGETSSTEMPLWGIEYDDDPASPTFAGTDPANSIYGRVTRFFASPLLTTQGMVNKAARKILRREVALTATWAVSKGYEPRIDPGDVIAVSWGETVKVMVVDAVTVNIAGPTVMACRDLSELEA